MLTSLLIALSLFALSFGQFTFFPAQVNYVNSVYKQVTYGPQRFQNTSVTTTNVFKYLRDVNSGKTQFYVQWSQLFNGANYSGESWSFYNTRQHTGVIYVTGTGV
jgi:hypothetical protein